MTETTYNVTFIADYFVMTHRWDGSKTDSEEKILSGACAFLEMQYGFDPCEFAHTVEIEEAD